MIATNFGGDSKFHGANMGPTWGRQDPGGTHVGPMNLAIWVFLETNENLCFSTQPLEFGCKNS